ncbi:hypothetical protein [Acidipila sp. EB88]|uniref:hypothetical protein n=1 Tax=Acidipila sp. EB88 TaxID=2305226 RepID=UPI000F5FCC23|nr:hypothetical protein [Acidipila sp. EB88]RRA48588.1 hypothetical protein D1Y84_10110 [Acidipila sp. EB88]
MSNKLFAPTELMNPDVAERSSRPDPGERPDPGLLAALTGGDAAANRALSLRTRRAVYNEAVRYRSDQRQDRRGLSIAFLITGALTLALAPALWAGIDDMLGGETLLDLPGMLVALAITMFAAVAAVLSLVGSERRTPQMAHQPLARNQRR